MIDAGCVASIAAPAMATVVVVMRTAGRRIGAVRGVSLATFGARGGRGGGGGERAEVGVGRSRAGGAVTSAPCPSVVQSCVRGEGTARLLAGSAALHLRTLPLTHLEHTHHFLLHTHHFLLHTWNTHITSCYTPGTHTSLPVCHGPVWPCYHVRVFHAAPGSRQDERHGYRHAHTPEQPGGLDQLSRHPRQQAPPLALPDG